MDIHVVVEVIMAIIMDGKRRYTVKVHCFTIISDRIIEIII